jgi:hypothetical protein
MLFLMRFIALSSSIMMQSAVESFILLVNVSLTPQENQQTSLLNIAPLIRRPILIWNAVI